MSSNNNENIYELLSQHDFTLIDKSIDDYKCVICERIVINAYGAYCGCNYCQKCVDEQVRSGVVFCPGETEECKTATLCDVAINHRINRQISQLSVKCPEERCHYKSQLKDMGEHLRLCATKSVECPFIDFGCVQRTMKMDKLNEHLQQDSHRHSEILIGVIGNLRNELAKKGEIINLMREEMEIMKLEKVALEQRVDNLANLLNSKADKTTLEQQVGNLENLFDAKAEEIVEEIEEKLEDMREELRGAMEQQQLAVANAEERNEVQSEDEDTEESDSVDDSSSDDSDCDFVWTIGSIILNRQKKARFYSDYFLGPGMHKMRLHCHCSADELRIRLYLDSDDSTGNLDWPFARSVTISIAHPTNPDLGKSLANNCIIVKPILRKYECSKPFSFDWDELANGGMLAGNSLLVRCSFDDEQIAVSLN